MSTKLRIVTLNFWGIPYVSKHVQHRLNALTNALRQDSYDIVALQEVWSKKDFLHLSTECRHVLPYAHYFYSGVIGSGLCVLSKHPIESTLFWPYTVNGKCYKLQHGDFFAGKGIGLCRITVGTTDIDLFVTHLHASYKDDFRQNEYDFSRIAQAWQVVDFVQSTRRPGAVHLLCGDLNYEVTELGFTLMKEGIPLRDAADIAAEDFCTCDLRDNPYTGRGKREKRIDYILFGGTTQLNCDECHVVLSEIPGDQGMHYSDHEGVEASFTLSPRQLPSASSLEPQVRITKLFDAAKLINDGLEDANKRRHQHILATALLVIAWLFFLYQGTLLFSSSVATVMSSLLLVAAFFQLLLAFAFIPFEANALRQTSSSLRQAIERLQKR